MRRADGATADAAGTTPPTDAATAAPTDRAGEADERVTPTDVVVRPLRRSWNAQDGREGAPYYRA